MTEFVEWKPEHEGHKPPFWEDGMAWDCMPFDNCFPPETRLGWSPGFYENAPYRVPREAVYGPAVDWTKPICIQAETWQAELPATLVYGPDGDGDYKVRIDAPHMICENSTNFDAGLTWWFDETGGCRRDTDENIRVINKSVTPSIDSVLYERMAEVIKQIAGIGYGTEAKVIAATIDWMEAKEIASLLPEEPVDPILKLAREVCDEVTKTGIKYTAGKHDSVNVMKVALAMAKAMKERGL